MSVNWEYTVFEEIREKSNGNGEGEKANEKVAEK